MAAKKPNVFLSHGEHKGREALAACVESRFGIRAGLPKAMETIEV
jgi:predicted metal-dependent RNase